MVKWDGYLFEKGFDLFLVCKLVVIKLVKEVGLGRELVGNEKGKFYILVKDILYVLFDGVVMGILIKLFFFIIIGLFLFVGKLCVVVDFFILKIKN